jgi:hypothetical protein
MGTDEIQMQTAIKDGALLFSSLLFASLRFASTGPADQSLGKSSG